MTDRELLELAARAAGWTLDGHTQCSWKVCLGGAEWNPLEDDGDALQLAVQCSIEVVPGDGVCFARPTSLPVAHTSVRSDGNPYAATRRAIVRAAAEIGRVKP